jgi:hypothetical protein
MRIAKVFRLTLLSVTVILANWFSPTICVAQQAAILANGEWVANGFRISDFTPDGPLANLEREENGTTYRGAADPGDIITHVNGQRFGGRTDFLQLLAKSYQERAGKSILSIQDVRTGNVAEWEVRLVLATGLSDTTPQNKTFSLLDLLGPRPEIFRIK